MYQEFYQRFGGSFRTKHLCLLPTGFLERLLWSYEFLKNSNRDALLTKRFYTLPRGGSLPKEFIRLEPWEGEYLYLLAARAGRSIVEVGRFRGGSTFMLACANATVPIYSIDITPQDDETLRRYLKGNSVGDNVHLIVGDSQNTDYPDIFDVDMLFIDGDHSYQGCTNDLEHWYSKVVDGGHIVLHDAYYGSEVQNSVLDFIDRHKNSLEIVRSPYIVEAHWRTEYGSLAHLIKRKGMSC